MTASVRHARDEDVYALTNIYNHYVLASPATFDLEPRTVVERSEWLTQFSLNGHHQLLVAVDDNSVIGYACSTRFRTKAAYDTSVETSIYVHPDAVAQGLGKVLYGALFEAIGGVGVHRAFAGITLPNSESVALHERLGFKAIGAFHEVGYKFDRYWDVAWYEKSL
ncbi:MAG: N-acetyltransferase family protein [Pseudomonadota bacterium]